MKKILISLIIFIFLTVLLSPLIALFLPKKLKSHTYAELVYQVIADRETKDCKNDEERILKLFDYVRTHIYPQGSPYKGKPLDYLITGRGWCDYQARTLNSLLGRLNINSRYAMLVDENGVSPHTLNEIFIDGKWAIFDTMGNVIFKYKGVYLDTALLREKPELITSVLENTDLPDVQQQTLEQIYLRTLPFEKNWRRSTPRIKQYHIVDYLTGFYARTFGQPFQHFYQDVYLNLSLSQLLNEEKKLFLRARHYHLLYRKELADNYYQKLIANFPHGEYTEECIRLRQALNRQ